MTLAQIDLGKGSGASSYRREQLQHHNGPCKDAGVKVIIGSPAFRVADCKAMFLTKASPWLQCARRSLPLPGSLSAQTFTGRPSATWSMEKRLFASMTTAPRQTVVNNISRLGHGRGFGALSQKPALSSHQPFGLQVRTLRGHGSYQRSQGGYNSGGQGQGWGRRMWKWLNTIRPERMVYGIMGINIAVYLLWQYAQNSWVSEV